MRNLGADILHLLRLRECVISSYQGDHHIMIRMSLFYFQRTSSIRGTYANGKFKLTYTILLFRKFAYTKYDVPMFVEWMNLSSMKDFS
jgi:hypothetical protein